MKPTAYFALLLGGLIGMSSIADAAPPTIWDLVFGNSLKAAYDASANKHGKHPALERKPPLTALVDPANFESPNPAIALAAELKKAEDEAPQKIKAIKHLAEIGCDGPDGCHANVGPALLAALDDCTEDVRLAAAEALAETAGDPCKHCAGAGCCSDAALTKLNDVAHGRDENGCFLESSLEVRRAAALALIACQRAVRSTSPVYDDEFPETLDRDSGLQPDSTTFAPPFLTNRTSPIVAPLESTDAWRPSQGLQPWPERRDVNRISGYMQGPPPPGHARN